MDWHAVKFNQSSKEEEMSNYDIHLLFYCQCVDSTKLLCGYDFYLY